MKRSAVGVLVSLAASACGVVVGDYGVVGADAGTGADTSADQHAGSESGGSSGSGSGGSSGAGCGPTDTTSNCGACGVVCIGANAAASSCNGTTCLYTCNSGHLDCNTATPPNTDGCECPGTACCAGGTCQTSHTDGVGNTFYDCETSVDDQLAHDACKAFTGSAAECSFDGPCTGTDGGATGDMVVCSYGSPINCICWDYSGPDKGYVAPRSPDPPSGSTCNCPTSGGARSTWQ